MNIDFNAILTSALTQAVQQVTTPLIERIGFLESRLADIEAGLESVTVQMGEHLEEYDHDKFVSEVDTDQLQEAVGNLDISDQVKEAVDNIDFGDVIKTHLLDDEHFMREAVKKALRQALQWSNE
jgi:hypothetical protein